MMTLTEDPERYRHPLDAIPLFRRIPPSLARDLLYTLLMCIAIAVTFSLISKLNFPLAQLSVLLYRNAVFCLAIGYSIHLMSVLSHRIITKWVRDGAQRYQVAGGVTAAALGGMLGFWIATLLIGSGFRMWTGMGIAVAWVSALMAGMVIAQRRRLSAELAFERERSARIEAERLMTASRLKLLQAQIEPHFLFNTLAGVSSLIEADPRAARKMVDELCVFLRAALDSTRRPTATLKRELDVIGAYLSVLKVRMGARLEYSIDAPNELLETEIPSMILQPLVENAVQHGIDSKLEGGEVRIHVRLQDKRLQLTVMDNGEGFRVTSKENVGMGTVRERLEVLFGDQAALRVTHVDGWTQVSVELPSLA
jgi:sensor histidine kinase YesM